MFRKIENHPSHTTTNQAAQFIQQQSRPPIPNNNKPPIPNKQPQKTISHFLIKIANYSKMHGRRAATTYRGHPSTF